MRAEFLSLPFCSRVLLGSVIVPPLLLLPLLAVNASTAALIRVLQLFHAEQPQGTRVQVKWCVIAGLEWSGCQVLL